MTTTTRFPGAAKAAGICAGICLLGAGTAAAQSGFYAAPSISIAEVYDDNIFYSSDDKESDFITRVSPGLEAGYESATLSGFASYTFDSEYYLDNEEVSDYLMRRFADAGVEYLATSRMALGLDATYAKTQTPGDLNIATGLETGRTEAERREVTPYVTYQFSSATSGALEYSYINDDLDDGIEIETQRVNLEGEHIWTSQSTLLAGYTYREYDFSDGTDTWSHTPTVGIRHDFTPRTQLTAEAGPRIAEDDEVDPYLLLVLAHDYANGDVEVRYERDETTLVGEAGRAENETLSAAWTHRYGPRWEFNVMPSYSTVSRRSSDADIYRVLVGANYRISNALMATASYQHSYQEEDFIRGISNELDRNVFLVGLSYTYPRPNDETTEP